MNNFTIDKKFLNLLSIKKEGKKIVYGYKNDDNLITIYSLPENEFAFIYNNDIITNLQETKNYVYNLTTLFRKFPFINFVILVKNSEKSLTKNEAIQINKKIKENIINNIDKRFGKVEIQETDSILYYSAELENLY